MKSVSLMRVVAPQLAIAGGCIFLIGLGFLMGYDIGKSDLRQIRHELEWSIEDLKSCEFAKQNALDRINFINGNTALLKKSSAIWRDCCLERNCCLETSIAP